MLNKNSYRALHDGEIIDSRTDIILIGHRWRRVDGLDGVVYSSKIMGIIRRRFII